MLDDLGTRGFQKKSRERGPRMSFWSAEKVREVILKANVISPYNEKRIKHGAYELSLGSQAFLTSDPNGKRADLKPREQISIPPGQFCLLITEEIITMPKNVIGFISVKASIKFQGLVNVSGFHVDPGFCGRLKFAVYNVGSRSVPLIQGDPVFPIWFCDLNQETGEGYDGMHNGQKEINTDDIRSIQGELASPAALKLQIDQLRTDHDKKITAVEGTVNTLKGVAITILFVLIGLFLLPIKTWFESRTGDPKPPSGSAHPNSSGQPNASSQSTDGGQGQKPTQGLKQPESIPKPENQAPSGVPGKDAKPTNSAEKPK
jgi:dCTP deaminase